MLKPNYELIEYVNVILNNITENGMARFDRADIKYYNDYIQRNTLAAKTLRKSLGVLDMITPVLIRKILKVNKREFPTAYTHLINALLLFEKNHVKVNYKYTANSVLQSWIKRYVIETEHDVFWKYPFKMFGIAFEKTNTNKQETMCLHYLARFGQILCTFKDNKELEQLNRKTLLTTIKQHNFTQFSTGLAISYHYHTKDATININTEFLDWLTASYSSFVEHPMKDEIDRIKIGITRFIINEQNKDGSWFYYGKDFMLSHNYKEAIDCYHTGTVLHNIINSINSGNLNTEYEEKTIIACNKGMVYYLDCFFNFEIKHGKYKHLSANNRKYGPVHFSEAIFAFCQYLKSPWADSEISKRIAEIIPICMQQLLSLIDEENGSMPSDFIGPLVLRVNSVRWGNGPTLEAIARYMEIEKLLNSYK